MPVPTAVSRLPFHRTLRFRLSAVIALVIFVTVMGLAGAGEWRGFTRELETKRSLLSGAASAYAAALSDPVAAGSRADAIATLRGVREIPGVVQTDIRLADGRMFAQIGSGAILLGRDGNPDNMTVAQLWAARQLRIDMPILSGGEQIGTFGLLADISDMRRNVFDSLITTALMTLFAMLAAMAAAQLLISRMTRPLRKLTAMMAAFGHDQAAQLDSVEAGEDETGLLANTFNTMIGSIRERDARIARHLETLEDQVEERTHDLRIARDEAEAANAAKSDFLATMSHEIRTPMNGMLVMADMLSAADLSQRHRRYADIIARSGKSLLTIINDILDLSKIESGKLDLETTPVELDALVADVASLFWERAREKRLEIATYIAPSVPARIVADPTRLNQVITNLVNNALKFTETGGVTISVDRGDSEDPDQAALVIEVRDTGIGIPEDKIDHIFEAFSQADQTTTRRFGGTGLGLTVCRRLVTAMGGEISVRSKVGEGSVFRVELSLPIEVDASLPTVSYLPIMIALDSKLQRDALSHILSAYGCTIVEEGEDMIIGSSGSVPPGAASPFIILSDIGDTRVDELIHSGAAADLLPNPYTRNDILALIDKARTGTFRGRQALTDSSAAVPRPTFEGLRVLAADDNAVNREVLREALSTLKVEVVFAEDGQSAVERAFAERFDAIFMDGSMPVMDGFEATRRIRETEQKTGQGRTPLYALTAQVAGTSASLWSEAGADGHITKPFTLDRLVAALSGIEPSNTAPEHPSETPAPDDRTALLDDTTLGDMAALGGGSSNRLQARVWELFRLKAPEQMAALVSAVQTGAPGTDVARLAHALKSMSLSSAASQLAELCASMETEANTGAGRDRLLPLLLRTAECLADTLQVMQERLDAPASTDRSCAASL